jgi:hypothetical protein
MGGTSDENAAALDLDASGAILTTGTFQGTADFDPNSGTFNLTSSGGNDAFVHKMTQTAPPAFAAFETHSAEAGISLFPNPAVEKVTISFVTDQVSDYTVSLFDMSGRLVKKDQGISYRGVNTLDLQFGNIARGIYQLHFNMNNRLEVKLLLVE